MPFFGNLYKKSGQDSSAKWSATLAVIALYRYQLEHGAWPATLAEALPVPPEDPFKNVFNYTLRHPEEEWTITTGSDLKFASDEVAQAKAKAAAKAARKK